MVCNGMQTAVLGHCLLATAAQVVFLQSLQAFKYFPKSFLSKMLPSAICDHFNVDSIFFAKVITLCHISVYLTLCMLVRTQSLMLKLLFIGEK